MSDTSTALREQQTKLTRDLIMDALTDLILERGLPDFSIQQVADQAGVSHRTVYRHYPSRQALLEALSEWLDEMFTRHLRMVEKDYYVDFPDKLISSFSTMDEFARHVEAYVILSVGTQSASLMHKKRSDRVRKLVERGPARHLERGQAKAISALVRTMVSSTAWYQMTREHGVTGAEAGNVVRWAINLIFGALEGGAEPPSFD